MSERTSTMQTNTHAYLSRRMGRAEFLGVALKVLGAAALAEALSASSQTKASTLEAPPQDGMVKGQLRLHDTRLIITARPDGSVISTREESAVGNDWRVTVPSNPDFGNNLGETRQNGYKVFRIQPDDMGRVRRVYTNPDGSFNNARIYGQEMDIEGLLHPTDTVRVRQRCVSECGGVEVRDVQRRAIEVFVQKIHPDGSLSQPPIRALVAPDCEPLTKNVISTVVEVVEIVNPKVKPTPTPTPTTSPTPERPKVPVYQLPKALPRSGDGSTLDLQQIVPNTEMSLPNDFQEPQYTGGLH